MREEVKKFVTQNIQEVDSVTLFKTLSSTKDDRDILDTLIEIVEQELKERGEL